MNEHQATKTMLILNHGGRTTRTIVTRTLRTLGMSYNYVGPHREDGHTFPSRWYVMFPGERERELDAALLAAYEAGADIECYTS